MKILVTGSQGFVGKNLITRLQYEDNIEVFEYSKLSSLADLDKYTKKCDFVIHLAGVNRTNDKQDFYNVNQDLTSSMIKMLEAHNNLAPILLTSSIQSALDSDYGLSKKAGEDLVKKYGSNNNVEVYIYQLPNLFGKWSKPFYNSVVATWCHLAARSQELEISNGQHILELVYIDDLITEIISKINNVDKSDQVYYQVTPSYHVTLKELSEIILAFKESRKNLFIANMENELVKKLYSTYLSYLPKDDFKYELLSHKDERGSFTELLKSNSFGQVSINVASAFETKGYHWHHSKNEKFIVVKGKAAIKFRSVLEDQVIEYIVSDKKFEVVDIPTGYVHTIENLLEEELITVMWVNEPYDPSNSDTYIEKVEK